MGPHGHKKTTIRIGNIAVLLVAGWMVGRRSHKYKPPPRAEVLQTGPLFGQGRRTTASAPQGRCMCFACGVSFNPGAGSEGKGCVRRASATIFGQQHTYTCCSLPFVPQYCASSYVSSPSTTLRKYLAELSYLAIRGLASAFCTLFVVFPINTLDTTSVAR